jgi:hypothetical protein
MSNLPRARGPWRAAAAEYVSSLCRGWQKDNERTILYIRLFPALVPFRQGKSAATGLGSAWSALLSESCSQQLAEGLPHAASYCT